MNIRIISVSVSVALAALIMAVLAFDLYKMQQNRVATQGARASSMMLSVLSSALTELSTERDLVYMALGTGEGSSSDLGSSIKTTRNHVNEKLEIFHREIESASWADNPANFAELLGQSRNVLELFRDEADSLISTPAADRDPVRVIQLPGDFTNIIISLRQIASGLRRSDVSIPHQMVFLEKLEELTWSLFDYGGRERAALALIIANPDAAEQNLGYAAQMIDRAVLSWQEIQPYFKDTKLPPDVLEQLTKVRTEFFEDYWFLRDEITYLAQSGEAFPLSSDEFLQQSAAAMAGVASLQLIIEREKLGFWSQQAQDQFTALLFYASIALVGLLLSAYFLFFMVRRVTGRINAMTAVMCELAKGDTRIDLSGFQSRDELGEMAQAVEVFRENAERVSELTAEREAQQKRSEEKLKQEMTTLTGTLEQAIKQTVVAVEEKSSQMKAMSQKMTTAVTQVQDQSQSATTVSLESADRMQNVATATNELSSSISQVEQAAKDALGLSVTAVDKAKKTNLTVNELKEAGGRIGTIVGVINDIAEQTNLLALNATIEAARAGEAGRGFSIVASEVKSLANQTVKATEGVAEQISSMQRITDEAVTAIEDIGSTIDRMSEIADSIAASVNQQESDTNAIAENIRVAAKDTERVSSSISEVSDVSSNSGLIAVEVDAAASQVTEQISELETTITSAVRSWANKA
ncbi:methyl-accepting chemotaxis protein [Pelagibius sp. Alg239-R121]|uniref:methyl-accepting chemotaxis protein n=1 Tax=Pelagibius sp. Alg239-R121 TaxID=2993448 RepID=UPI0024A646C6|nr:HAMP domain-containing methyl-accepting chemotaxis protein [Pelagibius sp. Alg239-R121]